MYSRNRFKTYEVCMEYCDDVMQKEKDMSPDPNGDSETTNAIAPDSGRYYNFSLTIYH